MSEYLIEGLAGLDTEQNQLDVRKGGLAVASNCAIERPGVLQPRRGLASGITLTSYKKCLRTWEFNGLTMFMVDDNGTRRIGYDNGAFNVLSATVDNPSSDERFRLHEVEASGVLFVATADGIRRYTDYNTDDGFAGVPAMPDMDRANSSTASGSLIADNTQRAYRACMVYRPSSGQERIGAPSGRLVFRNSSGGAVDPTIRVLLPVAVNTESTDLSAGNWWVQLYSSDNSAGVDEDPGDEMALVYEYLLTSSDITAGYVDITDKTPYALAGSSLYSNSSQGGSAASKEPPQHTKCIARYRDCLIVANTTSRQYFELSILSTDPAASGNGGIADGDTITFNQDGTSFTCTAKTSPSTSDHYKLENTSSASTDIKLTAQNLVACINRHASNSFCYAFYAGVPGDPRTLGRIFIESRLVNTAAFTVYVGSGDNTTCFEPQLPESSTIAVQSKADEFSNGWAISEPSEPDAFPPFRYGRMGAGNIIWISALEDACFFWHDSGEVWMLSGDPGFGGDLGTLRAERRWTDIHLLAPFTALVVDGKVVALTDRGVIALSPSGYEVLSRPIDSALHSAIATLTLATVREQAFAVAHPASRRYQLWLANAGSGVCYELDLRTAAWTTRSGSNVQDILSGHYSPTDDLLHYGNTGGASSAKLWDEANGESAVGFKDDSEGYTATVTFPPFVLEGGTRPKQLREVQLAFESSQPTTINATVTTELGTGTTTAVTSQSTNLCRIPVPQSVQRGVRHTLSLTISTQGTKWLLSSAKFLYRAYEQRGSR